MDCCYSNQNFRDCQAVVSSQVNLRVLHLDSGSSVYHELKYFEKVLDYFFFSHTAAGGCFGAVLWG